MTFVPSGRSVVVSAAAALKSRSEEVNRLNVFPVPDGDTGTNMSLTLEAVATDVSKLPLDASIEAICKASTHGSLMGARGNSGVILSQIIRGVCEGLVESEGQSNTERIAYALEQSCKVAFQAVRKPVEGTILTVIRDMSVVARAQADQGASVAFALDAISAEAHDSVRRTPDLLPVLKEANVVDAGGYGLAILWDAAVGALLGREVIETPLLTPQGSMSIVPVDDWDDDEYLYCTEFLLFGPDIDKEVVHDYIAQRGGSELVVGDSGQFKVHVHTDNPAEILGYALAQGEIAEVHIHNMRMQQAERPAGGLTDSGERKPVGVVAVASGSGLVKILKSLGVDVVVTGGQTMNPSTQDLVDAALSINAENIIFLPNNKNIIMAANAAVGVLEIPSAVVPTRSVPEAFAALLMYDGSQPFEELVEEMSDAMTDVVTAEITTAIKDAKGKVGDITAGQTIGILNGKEIEAVGDDVESVALDLLALMVSDSSETLTLLAGLDFDDQQVGALMDSIENTYSSLDVETHRGEQPLYPLIMSVE